MAFTATKREWSELCAFFQLLGRGKVFAGNAAGQPVAEMPIAYVQREEHDGTRKYHIADNEIHVVGESIDRRFLREDFETVASLILEALKSSETEVESPEGVEEFLDELSIFNLEAKTEDRTDLYIAFYSAQVPPVGFRIYSRIGGMNPLLDGGRAANIKFEQKGVRFPSPAIHKINALESDNTVLDRMLMIERLGGEFKFEDAADKIFRSNLHMIDLHFPRMVGEMLRTMYYDNITKVSELVDSIKVKNPLKIKDELIRKHGYYEHKMKDFLLAIASGMRPAKLYDGKETAVGGMLILNADGQLLCYSKLDRQTFADFLYQNTRLEKGNLQKDHYGVLERENNLFYFKLNLKVGLLKR
ncbi:MAG: HpaII family restriction endonuclease [Bacteroidaceae bacterium]|nr:HpaII family restriction endonuclease [Bacteroidaceae bacterium]